MFSPKQFSVLHLPSPANSSWITIVNPKTGRFFVFSTLLESDAPEMSECVGTYGLSARGDRSYCRHQPIFHSLESKPLIPRQWGLGA